MARIEHPPSWASLKEQVLHTIAASGRRDGIFVRYWLSAGRGDFMVSPRQCEGGAQFYCMVHEGGNRSKAVSASVGIGEALVPEDRVPHKPLLLANSKTNNYLLNALTSMDAEDHGGTLGIGVTSQGIVTEQATACVGFLGSDGVLRAPKFEEILESTTLRRAMELTTGILPLPGVCTKAELTDVTLEHVADAVEIISFGGGGVLPIVNLHTHNFFPGSTGGDSDPMKVIGEGVPGPLFKAIHAAVERDMEESPFLDPIPYKKFGF